mgnify:CR=1 FL=1
MDYWKFCFPGVLFAPPSPPPTVLTTMLQPLSLEVADRSSLSSLLRAYWIAPEETDRG